MSTTECKAVVKVTEVQLSLAAGDAEHIMKLLDSHPGRSVTACFVAGKIRDALRVTQ